MLAKNPNSLENFTAWLRQQPASASYDWTDCKKCAVGNYLKATTDGITYRAYVDFVYQTEGWQSNYGYDEPWTYGALLERIKRGQNERSQ